MSAPRVALLGSCVTRDTWDLPEFAHARPDLVLGRTSLASVSMPDGVDNPFASLAALVPAARTFACRAIRTELNKTGFAQIADARPDVLILDFIDERFDLLTCANVLVTESFDLIESGVASRPLLAGARRISRLSGQAWSQWQDGLMRLRRAFDDGVLPACRILLHACLWAEEIATSSGREPLPDHCEILPGRSASRAAHQDLLRRLHESFAALFPEAGVIEVPAELRIADAGHRWGPAPFHFIAPYYRAFARAAQAHGVPLSPMAV